MCCTDSKKFTVCDELSDFTNKETELTLNRILS